MSNTPKSNADRSEATDAYFDTSDHAMAARFGRRAIEVARDGGDPKWYARLAASLAFKAEPRLRLHEAK